MTRVIWSLLNFPLLVLIATFAVAIQSSLFSSYPLHWAQPDFVLILVLWCAFKRSFEEGGALCLIMAHIAEIHSTAPAGVFLVAYMSVFLGVRGIHRAMVLPDLRALTLLAMGASVFWKGIHLAALYLMDLSSMQWRHTLSMMLPGALTAGLCAYFGFKWLERLDWVTFKNPRARQMMEDELQIEGEGL